MEDEEGSAGYFEYVEYCFPPKDLQEKVRDLKEKEEDVISIGDDDSDLSCDKNGESAEKNENVQPTRYEIYDGICLCDDDEENEKDDQDTFEVSILNAPLAVFYGRDVKIGSGNMKAAGLFDEAFMKKLSVFPEYKKRLEDFCDPKKKFEETPTLNFLPPMSCKIYYDISVRKLKYDLQNLIHWRMQIRLCHNVSRRSGMFLTVDPNTFLCFFKSLITEVRPAHADVFRKRVRYGGKTVESMVYTSFFGGEQVKFPSLNTDLWWAKSDETPNGVKLRFVCTEFSLEYIYCLSRLNVFFKYNAFCWSSFCWLNK